MIRLKNEKGIALVTVLTLSLIALAIVSTLIYFVIQGTRFSGAFKRYETAREAATGGAEIAGDIISNRGNLVIPGLINFPNACNCGDPDDPNDNRDSLGNRTCLCDKLCSYTADWPVGCSSSLDPMSSPDMQIQMPGFGSTTYQVSAKIIDTTLGNSDLSGEQLGGSAVSSSTSNLINAPPLPYLHRVEINSQELTNPIEKTRLSVLYAY